MAVFGVADGNLVVSSSVAPEPGLSLPWRGVHTRTDRRRHTHTHEEGGHLVDFFVLTESEKWLSDGVGSSSHRS